MWILGKKLAFVDAQEGKCISEKMICLVGPIIYATYKDFSFLAMTN